MWCRRNPLLAGAVSAVALLMITLTIGSLWAAYHFGRMARAEQASHRQADRRLAVINHERARSACEQGKIASGLLWFIESWRSADAAGDAEWRRLARRSIAAWQSRLPRLVAVLPSKNSFRQAVFFAPDDRAILTVDYDAAVKSRNATAKLWDITTASPIGRSLQLTGMI
jgi:hypothetical protein